MSAPGKLRPGLSRALVTALIVALIGVFGTPRGASGQATIQGIITDAESGQPLEGALISVESADAPGRGTLSDRNGFYLVGGIPAGSYTLRVAFIGYVPYQVPVTLTQDGSTTVSVALELSPVELEEVVVEPIGGAAERELGRQQMTAAQIGLAPVPAASGDLATYLQTMPGVITSGDRGGQLFVRGGTHTENLALIDGLLIYQPFHILGFFSAFPEDLVSSVDFYAGGFGARYTGRTSSVLDVRMRDGNRTSYSGSGSVSPFLADVLIEGPGDQDGGYSFILAARRSLLEETSPFFLGEEQPLGFESQYVKLTSFGDENSRCSAMGMRTVDQGRMDPEDEVSRVSWSNFVAGGRCIQLFEGILRLLEISMGFSSIENTAVSRGASRLSSETRRFQTDVNTTNLFRGIPFEAGYYLRLEEMDYNLGELFGTRADAQYLWGAGAYVETGVALGDRLLLRPGLTASFSPPKGVEPRLRWSWRPLGAENQELSGALGLYRQALAGMTDTRDASSVFVAWGLVPEEEAMTSIHAQLGWQQTLGSGLQWSIEGYHRRMSNVPVPLWSTVAHFNTQLSLADGKAYGADLRLEYNRPGLYGFVGYGLSWTEYEAAQDHFTTWFGEPVQRYHPPHDRRHQINALLNTELGPWTLGARWQLGTGLPFTRPMGYDESFDFRFTIQDVTGNRGTTRLIVDKPYQGRLPIVHRLDVSLERDFNLPFGSLRAQAGAINLYDRTNMFYYDIFTHRRIDQLPLAPYASLRLEVP